MKSLLKFGYSLRDRIAVLESTSLISFALAAFSPGIDETQSNLGLSKVFFSTVSLKVSSQWQRSNWQETCHLVSPT
jgi:hypothetical protein